MEFQKQLAYELIKNDYLEKEEAALHCRSTRIQDGIGHGLLSLPPYKKFVGMKIVTFMSNPPPPPQMQLLQKGGTQCTPGVHLCSHCLAEHIHDVNNEATFFPPRRILYLVQNSVSPSVGRNLVNIHSFLRFVVVSYSLFLLDCCDI